METPRRNSDPDPTEVVPFGRYGAGLMTAHPVGLVLVIGLLLMGLFGLPGAPLFFVSALLLGGIFRIDLMASPPLVDF